MSRGDGGDPRFFNKIVRTPGINISKLKKFFDSNGHDSSTPTNLPVEKPGVFARNSANKTSTSDDSSVESNNIASQTVTENNSRSSADAVHCLQTEAKPLSVAADDNCFLRCERKTQEMLTESYNVEIVNSVLRNEVINVSESEIYHCERITNAGLWENVNIDAMDSSDGLWNAKHNQSNFNEMFCESFEQESSPYSSYISSTSELTDLIAASRAELSKKEEPIVNEKSMLENYFTSAFENSKPRNVSLNHQDNTYNSDMLENDHYQNDFFHTNASDQMFQNPSYDCDMNEITFDDDDTNLSDASSEDEHVQPISSSNAHYLPAYALHTIIEESCEESEQDSHTATPTNEGPTSKLERYFSWDIINDAKLGGKREEDNSLYSDSLSEHSDSLNGEVVKEVDTSHLASSRLEKYFTSGLVGNENYFYPEDAEFWDDASVSDFDEDSAHQKISRSALLNSIESKQESSVQTESLNKTFDISSTQIDLSDSKELLVDAESVPNTCDTNQDFTQSSDSDEVVEAPTNNLYLSVQEIENNKDLSDNIDKDKFLNENVSVSVEENEKSTLQNLPLINNTLASLDISEENLNLETMLPDDIEVSKSAAKTVHKSQLAIDAQAIMKKLILYITDNSSFPFGSPMEMDYVSAWQVLETEIERLMQSVSHSVALENHSCNSSTIDSNNSDYGSDTIESVDCITDDDENSVDAKSKISSRSHLVEFLSSAYKSDFNANNFNISEETLSIWKRLIESLQKDTLALSEHRSLDESEKARLYIRDQIIALMHTVTITESSSPVSERQKCEEFSELENDDFLLAKKSQSANLNCDKNLDNLMITEEDNILNQILKQKSDSDNESITSSDSNKTRNVISEIPCKNDDDLLLYNTELSLRHSILPSPKHFADTSDLPLLEAKQTVSIEDKIIVDKLDKKQAVNSSFENNSNVKDLQFSVFVDIELGDETSTITERKRSESLCSAEEEADEITKRSSLHLWVSDEHVVEEGDGRNPKHVFSDISTENIESQQNSDSPKRKQKQKLQKAESICCRDTGYYSFKSSDDSLLDAATASRDISDVVESKSNDSLPDFKSLKRTIKKFTPSSTLSKSTNNILQSLSETKFNTLQVKSHKVKTSHNVGNLSRPFSSLFSPSSVLKRFTSSKSNESQISESSVPAKYLKKYSRSTSIDNESMLGATSMPQLTVSKQATGDSYSAIGLYPDCDRDSSIMLDEEIDSRPYNCHSVLSLGSHSASMTSVYSAAGGYHYGYVTVSGDVLFGLNYNQKSQMMEVFVKQCRNLAAVDVKKNKSDPYVKVYLLPDKTKGGKRKTKTKKNTVSPVFNELLRFPVLKHELESRTLWLSVWNSDLFGRNDFLGEITLPLGYRLLECPTLRWYPLQERIESLWSPLKYRGEVFLALKYVPRDLSLEGRLQCPSPAISLRGALHILVKEARNMAGANHASDAFCKSYLLPDKSKTSKQKTPVVRKSRHPKWYCTLIYEDLSIEELKERSLELTLWDHDKITSNEFMGGVRLNTASGLYHGVPIDWMDSRRDEASLWQSMLDTPNMWVDGSLPLRPTMQF